MFVKVKSIEKFGEETSPLALLRVSTISSITEYGDGNYKVILDGNCWLITDQEGYDKILKVIDVEE